MSCAIKDSVVNLKTGKPNIILLTIKFQTMNGAHWHLMLNHFPAIGGIFSALLLLASFLFKSAPFRKAGLSLLIISGLIAIPALLTGEGAEDSLKAIGQKNNLIHPHEEAAEVAFWVLEATAILGLLAFLMAFRKEDLSKKLTAITFIGTLIATGLFLNVNNLGGKIRHTEIRTGNTTLAPDSSNVSNVGEKDND